jgi:hypothetical protein
LMWRRFYREVPLCGGMGEKVLDGGVGPFDVLPLVHC